MKSKWSMSILHAVIYILAWFLAYYVVITIFNHSSSRYAYGSLSGWWCALFVGYIFKIELKTMIPLLFVYILGAVIDLVFGLGWFYHDAPREMSLGYFILLLSGFLLFASPIFINIVIRYFMTKFKNKK